MKIVVINDTALALLRLREGMKPWAAWKDDDARPPANFTPTPLKSSRVRRSARLLALITCLKIVYDGFLIEVRHQSKITSNRWFCFRQLWLVLYSTNQMQNLDICKSVTCTCMDFILALLYLLLLRLAVNSHGFHVTQSKNRSNALVSLT